MKIKWYHYVSIGSFVAGWLVRATMEKRDATGQVVEKKNVITETERAELGHALVEMINEMLGGDIKL